MDNLEYYAFQLINVTIYTLIIIIHIHIYKNIFKFIFTAYIHFKLLKVIINIITAHLLIIKAKTIIAIK